MFVQKVLNTLLLEWRQDRSSKVLIFTKSVKLLEMLEFHLSSNSMSVLQSVQIDVTNRTGYGWVKLDGSVDPKDRTLTASSSFNSLNNILYLRHGHN
jgi:DNA excision repair protein ERCC-6-like 2